MQYFISLIILTVSPMVFCQSDGNPHVSKYYILFQSKSKKININHCFLKFWDRRRRCDLFDYDPPCGVCEGMIFLFHKRPDKITIDTKISEENIDPNN